MKSLPICFEAVYYLRIMKDTVTRVDLPSRSAILGKLGSLVKGELSHDDASRWAEVWLLADQVPGTDIHVTDWPAWETLKMLSGADLQVEPGSYLYGVADFEAWFESLKAAPLPYERPKIL